MDKKNLRLIITFGLLMVAFYMFEAWQDKNSPASSSGGAGSPVEILNGQKGPDDFPNLPTSQKAAPVVAGQVSALEPSIPTERLVKVKTKTMNFHIDTLGGDIVYADLPAYHKTLKDDSGIVLLNNEPNSSYVLQSGLLSAQGPELREAGKSKRGQYQASQKHYDFTQSTESQSIDLVYTTANGVRITKRFSVKPNSYVLDIAYIIDNQSTADFQGRMYGRIKRKAAVAESGFLGMRTFSGIALNTEDKPYRKFPYKDLAKKNFEESKMGGWAAMVDHYFLTAMIPSNEQEHFYRTEMFGNDTYGAVLIAPEVSVAEGSTLTIPLTVYIGPENTEVLGSLAKGLELTADYGIFWPICEPIFWLLKKINALIGNWGIAIILTTILIKALFYKLSASSYKSMANMRKLQPKMAALKEKHGADKQKFSQEMMGMYKQEKVNPLGGCLPIIVQIPVFLGLYYVLLSTVELRQAPFMFWIQDLSAKDPFYVLPVLMGATMLIQQRLSPPPPDPMQAKVMMAMPVVFTFIFLSFPSGLVLYWFVNNLLSITQQWYITRKIENQAQQKKWAKKT